MKDLEADGIGEPIIMGDQIMIPIGDIVYSGKLEMSFFDLLSIMKSAGIQTMDPYEASKCLEDMVRIIESKFSPDGIILNLRHMDNAAWIIETFLTAYNEHNNYSEKTED